MWARWFWVATVDLPDDGDAILYIPVSDSEDGLRLVLLWCPVLLHHRDDNRGETLAGSERVLVSDRLNDTNGLRPWEGPHLPVNGVSASPLLVFQRL